MMYIKDPYHFMTTSLVGKYVPFLCFMFKKLRNYFGLKIFRRLPELNPLYLSLVVQVSNDPCIWTRTVNIRTSE